MSDIDRGRTRDRDRSQSDASRSSRRSSRSRSPNETATGRLKPIDPEASCLESWPLNRTLWCQGCEQTDRSKLSSRVDPAECHHPLRDTRLIELCQNVNDLVDICNGRRLDPSSYNSTYTNGSGKEVKGKYDAHFTKENGREIQEKLLDILAWFADWKAFHDEEVKNKRANKYNFLPEQTWNNLNRLVMGLVVIIEFYCIGLGWEIVPRKLNTDPCENHFANARQSGGSTGNINVVQASLADSNAGTAKIAGRVAGANNQYASKVGTFKKY